ncbi:MAG: ATP-binding protein [Polyangiales bacterium]
MFEPHPSITDPEDRRRSQMLSACLLVVASLFGVVDTSFTFMVPGYQAPWFGYLTLLTALMLNRSGRYRLAAALTVAMFPTVIFAIVYLGQGMPFVSFGYLVIAPMVASIFLPLSAVAAVVTIDLLIIATSPFYAPEVARNGVQLVGPLTANAMVGLLVLLYMKSRNVLEQERRRALEVSEERLQLSLDAAQMGTWELDCRHERLTLDARARSLLGAIESVDALLAASEAEDAARLQAALTASRSGRRPSFALVVQLRVQAPATPRYVELTGRAATDARGQVARVIGTLVDTSERRNLEDQLRQAQKMEALGRMSGGIAHDFNNVLTVIMASVALLRRRSPSPELDHIDKAARSAAALTSKLLAFSRGAVLAPRVLDLDKVVHDVLPLIMRLTGPDVGVEHKTSDARWSARIDGTQLEQVLLNLAANARDAMPDGGTLGIQVEDISLPAGDYVRLRVSDTGVGMDEATRRHIFEPFFTTKPRGEGTGLGLAMVFGAVTQSGGFIETHSELGEGTRFDLFFPRASVAPPTRDGALWEPRRGSETLLVVDDDPAVRDVIGLILEGAGYHVRLACSASEARACFAAHGTEIALLITDEVMPDGRGSELAFELRRVRASLPALCMTGYVEPRASDAERPAAELPTLQKPFEDQVLLHRVRELLDGRRVHA